MDTAFIKKANKSIRDKRPYFSEDKVCEVFLFGDLLEIGFLSRQCENDLAGTCIMCDYGRTAQIRSIQTYLNEMYTILRTYGEGIRFLLLCSNGSILNEHQITTELLSEIMKLAQSCNIPNIIIETHYQDVTVERLDIIKHIIHKPVTIEMGLETINPKYQDALFMKGIEIKRYEETICRIQAYGYNVELNLMLGLPFLSIREQLEDVKQSINWAVCHKCIPIIFPINIKPYTMLRYIYDNGLYQPVSLWLLVLLLDSLEPEVLSRTLIAWYGNRDDPYPGDIPTILPQACDKCRNRFIEFGRAFLDTEQYLVRKTLVTELLDNTTCDCCQRVKHRLEQSKDDFETNYNRFYMQLKRDFKR